MQGQKQQELQKTLERLTSENCLVARCFEESGQELQQLEGQVAQMKKRFQIAKSEAVASLEEAQKAAKAAATSRGAGRDAEQSSALTASSKELLQPREENHQELHDAVQQLSTKVGRDRWRSSCRLQPPCSERVTECRLPSGVTREDNFRRLWGGSIASPRLALRVTQFPSSALGQRGSEWAQPWGRRGARVPRSQPSCPHDAPVVLQEEKFRALIASWLKEDKQENEALRQEIRNLEERLEEEEGCQYQRKKEAEMPETVLPEVVEARLERDVRARRRGFSYWLQTLLLLFVGLELAIVFAVAAAMLYASWYDPEVFHRLLPEEAYANLTCVLEAYANLACVLGKTLRAASEGLLPF
ncbi:uncharacterized protein [Haliaeetus albicilla]|uniref:uncharacterized protein n=1 Tax=Haliaeetus albicilla TaxID=8969 RepID=UPI0037E8DBA9